MKRLANVTFAFAVVMLLASCGAQPDGEKVEAQDAVQTEAPAAEAVAYTVDTESSAINWEGTKNIGNDRHYGTINITEGTLQLTEGNITGGTFTIDIATVNSTDMADAPKKKGMLEGHLKSGDFFDVANYPTGKFEVVSATPIEGATAEEDGFAPTHEITGNLTLKDVTKSITFKAAVEANDVTITAKTNQFVIDRTQWGVDHDNLKDKAINNNVGIQINLVAYKGTPPTITTEEVETE